MATGIVVQTENQEQKQNPFKLMAENLSQQALAVTVLETPDDYSLAGQRFIQHGEVAKKVAEFYDPKVAAAHEPWKLLTAERKSVLDVIEASKKHTSRLLTVFEQKQEAEAKRLQAENEKKQREQEAAAEAQRLADLKTAQDQKLEAALILQEEGLTAEADALLDTPVEVPEVEAQLPLAAPTLTAQVPKVQGLSGRANWKGRLRPTGGKAWPAEVSEEEQLKALVELCRAIGEGKVSARAVKLNESYVNRQCTDLKQMLGYPGIEVYDDRVRTGRS